MKINRKKILRWFLWVFQIFVLIILAGLVYFYVNRDDLTKKLLLEANKYTQGELFVENVGIDPLVHFPGIALSLKEVKFYEKKGESKNSTSTPILDLAEFNISFDIVKLLLSEIEITEISLQNGAVYLIQSQDGVFNLENALKPVEKDSVTRTGKKYNKDPNNDTAGSPQKDNKETISSHIPDTIPEHSVNETTDKEAVDLNADQPQPLNLNIDELEIEQIEVRIEMIPTAQHHHFNIEHTEAELKYVKDSIEAEMTTILAIDRLEISKNFVLEEEGLISSIAFVYDKGDKKIDIYQSDLEFRNAHFFVDGTVDLKEKGMVDLNFEAADDELAFTRLFLTSEGIDNLKSGNLFLRGTAKGPFKGQIPQIRCSFGADNMTVEIPKTGDYIRDLKLDGHFTSGIKQDFSEALIVVDTLHAHLPTGYIRMASRLRNLKTPILKYNLDASFRLENLPKIIDLGPIEDLGGRVTIKDSYQGALNQEAISHDLLPELFELKMDSIRFKIPDVVDIAHLNGRISGHLDSLLIDSLKIISGDSDLLVNGSVRKFSNFIFQADTLVAADVEISSKVFDFPYLFRALPNTASGFPYIIRDVELDVGMETSRQKLKEFRKVPEMDFAIHEVAASIDSLLDYVRLREGNFKIYEDERAFFLDFNDFTLLTDGTSSDAEFRYIEEIGKRDSMTFVLKTEGINPSQLLSFEKDSLPGLADAWLSGNYRGTIVLPFDQESTKLIHRADLMVDDFFYIAEDTISAEMFKYQTENISYGGETTKAVLATLDAQNNFQFKDLKSPFFQADSLGLQVDITNGIVGITPHYYDRFAKGETGTIKLFPYEEPPRIEVDYAISNLPLEDFLETFNSEELLKGTVDIKLDLDANGLDLESITSSLAGTIYVVGDSLMLQGLNLDDVIRDFQRSQSFNLVDIGAVVLTGPAGIVYSKGSSYVSLLTADKNDSTQISKFSSKWSLDTGKITADDVAFATLKNRVAAQGWLDMKTDSLDFSIGILNDKGCAIYNQRIFGSAGEPEYSKVKFLKTLLAPVTNVVKGALGVKCEVFYDGIVTHPEKAKKERK